MSQEFLLALLRQLSVSMELSLDEGVEMEQQEIVLSIMELIQLGLLEMDQDL